MNDLIETKKLLIISLEEMGKKIGRSLSYKLMDKKALEVACKGYPKEIADWIMEKNRREVDHGLNELEGLSKRIAVLKSEIKELEE